MTCTLKFAFAVIAISVGSGFQHGYHIALINVPAKVLQKWITTIRSERMLDKIPPDREIMIIWSITVAIFSVGGMLGACLIGPFADRCGRKKSLMWNNGIILVAIGFGLFSKSLNAFELFIFGRFLAGINAGLSGGLCQIYLSEISPDKWRGGICSIYQLVICISILISQIVGLIFGTEDDWPLIFLVAVPPALLQVVCLLLCPESPKYLLMHRDSEKRVKRALIWLKGDPENVGTEMEKLITEDNMVRQLHASLLSRAIGNSSLKNSFIMCSVLSISQQLCGVGSVIYFSTDIFQEIGMELEAATFITIGFSVVLALTTIITVFLVDTIGRRVMLLASFLGMAIFTSVLTYTLIIGSKPGSPQYTNCFSIVFISLFLAVFSLGAGPIPWFITAEIIIYSARSLAVSITVFCNWFANFLVGQTFLPLKDSIGYHVFIVFIILDIFFFCYALHWPETSLMSAIEIIQMYHP